jgi:hypothetical protein
VCPSAYYLRASYVARLHFYGSTVVGKLVLLRTVLVGLVFTFEFSIAGDRAELE